MGFKPATKRQAYARVFIAGPSGSGKTWSALKVMRGLVGPDGRMAVIDTERKSASKYAGDVERFDVDDDFVGGDGNPDFHPERFVKKIREAAEAGYDGLIVDSGSHEWMGQGGVLEIVDQAAKRNGGNKFVAWAVGTPLHQKFIDAILAAPMHVIVTLRAKSEYVLEQDARGKTAPKKVGMAAVQRDQFEFEADVFGILDLQHNLVIEKTRCPALDGKEYARPGEDVGRLLAAWLGDGAPPRVEFTVNGKAVSTAGVGKEALLELWNVSAKYDKAVGKKDAAKAVMTETTGKDSSLELTAPEAAKVTAALRVRLPPTGVAAVIGDGKTPSDAAVPAPGGAQ